MGRRTIGISLIVVGLVAFLGSVFMVGWSFWHHVFARTHAVPAVVRLHLDAERYVVYERTGHSDQYGPVSAGRSYAPVLVPDDLTVTGPGRDRVAVERRDTNMTIGRNGDQYVSVLEFRAPASGDYVLRFTNPEPTRVMIQRSFADFLRGIVPWVVAAILGVIATLGGILVLLLRRRPPPATTYAQPGAQWAADPYGDHRLRYWDGTAWTDHVAD